MHAAAGIRRERTAIRRVGWSRPIRVALSDNVINPQTTVFDYGCGHGDDIRYLSSIGIACSGWDPAFAPAAPRNRADVVNLGYVINVIENPSERDSVLRAAWDLANGILIVAARLSFESQSTRTAEFGDGFITSRSTFQKVFEQRELGEWIDATLDVRSVAAAPGIFYVFKDESAREGYSVGRFRRAVPHIRESRTELLFEQYREQFDHLTAFITQHGRPPATEELPAAETLAEKIGSVARAFSVLKRVTNDRDWELIRKYRSEDLLVYLAMSRFPRRPRFSDLPTSTQLDIKAFFGTYSRACEQSDSLLFSAGSTPTIDAACRSAQVGKLTGDALYVHETALTDLPAVLRVYEGCARVLVGRVDGGNVIKLHRFAPIISYASYPDFDTVAHPPLVGSLICDLRDLRVKYRDYTGSQNRPILHRKEQFVAASYRLRARFAKLTQQEEMHGLFEHPESIGYEDGWRRALAGRKLRIAGHRLLSDGQSD